MFGFVVCLWGFCLFNICVICVCPQDETPGTPKKKETKRKFKLEPHEDQVFLDGNEVGFTGTL